MNQQKTIDTLLRQLQAKQKRADFWAEMKAAFGWLVLGGLTIVSVSCMFEVLYGTGHTHPIWNKEFNWLPLIGQIIAVAGISSVIYARSKVYSLQPLALVEDFSQKLLLGWLELTSWLAQLIKQLLTALLSLSRNHYIDLKNPTSN